MLSIKSLVSILVGVIAGYVALHLAFWATAWLIWAWLAIFIAFCASVVASFITSGYMQAEGYDLAVDACASVVGSAKSLFARFTA